jgi:hypothetical protein
MNEIKRFAKVRTVFRVYIWNQRPMAGLIPQHRTTDGFARNADALSLAHHTPSTWSKLTVGNPRLEDARICNIVSCSCWYIIFFEFV